MVSEGYIYILLLIDGRHTYLNIQGYTVYTVAITSWQFEVMQNEANFEY